MDVVESPDADTIAREARLASMRIRLMEPPVEPSTPIPPTPRMNVPERENSAPIDPQSSESAGGSTPVVEPPVVQSEGNNERDRMSECDGQSDEKPSILPATTVKKSMNTESAVRS